MATPLPFSQPLSLAWTKRPTLFSAATSPHDAAAACPSPRRYQKVRALLRHLQLVLGAVQLRPQRGDLRLKRRDVALGFLRVRISSMRLDVELPLQELGVKNTPTLATSMTSTFSDKDVSFSFSSAFIAITSCSKNSYADTGTINSLSSEYRFVLHQSETKPRSHWAPSSFAASSLILGRRRRCVLSFSVRLSNEFVSKMMRCV